jgi:Penicillin tolerance protein
MGHRSERSPGSRAGLESIEATCPLVQVAHQAIRTLVGEGYHPVIVGQRDHVEVRGLTDDLEAFDVVLHERDVLQLEEHPRLGIAAQTTQPIEKVRHLVALMRQRFPQRRRSLHRYRVSPDEAAPERGHRPGTPMRRRHRRRRREQQQHP